MPYAPGENQGVVQQLIGAVVLAARARDGRAKHHRVQLSQRMASCRCPCRDPVAELPRAGDVVLAQGGQAELQQIKGTEESPVLFVFNVEPIVRKPGATRGIAPATEENSD